MKCPFCAGTGWISAYNNSDIKNAYFLLQQIGGYKCQMCEDGEMKVELTFTNDEDTRFITPELPKEGEEWFIKLNGASTLGHYEILEITVSTVVIRPLDNRFFSTESRYAKDDLQFIERVK